MLSLLAALGFLHAVSVHPIVGAEGGVNETLRSILWEDKQLKAELSSAPFSYGENVAVFRPAPDENASFLLADLSNQTFFHIGAIATESLVRAEWGRAVVSDFGLIGKLEIIRYPIREAFPVGVRRNRKGGRLPVVLPVMFNGPIFYSALREFAEVNPPTRDIGTQLVFGRRSGDPVGFERKVYRAENKQPAKEADSGPNRCPPGRISGCIRRFPLGAQIGVSLVIGGLALLVMWRAFRPFGLLVITRRDVFQGLRAALLGGSLLWLSGYVWMLGG